MIQLQDPLSSPVRLLVIEDEPDLLSGLAHALRKEGHAVDLASDGEDGLFKALGADYDAIVLDVMLPRLDGWTVLARLRQAKETPVLMLTARDATKDRVRGLDGGANDYLVKPFDMAELLARVRVLLRRGVTVARKTIELGPVRIDVMARAVTLAGEPVTLTAREYALLHYLAARRGDIVTRTELHEHILGDEDSTLSNLIDVHVFNLRKKLGPEVIATRRGQGYVIA